MAENRLGMKTLRFDFTEDGGTLTYENASGVHVLPFGAGHYHRGPFPETEYYGRRIGTPCHHGYVHVGDEVELLGLGEDKKSVVTGVEMFRKLLDEGQAGDNVGLLLRGIDKNEIKRGMVLCHPGQIKPFKKFKASIYVLKKEEGGRHTPFGNKYRPQFYLRTMDCTGEIHLPEGVEMVMPGDNVEITVELIYAVALNKGLRFAIREGGRTVGSGQITDIIDD